MLINHVSNCKCRKTFPKAQNNYIKKISTEHHIFNKSLVINYNKTTNNVHYQNNKQYTHAYIH
jgi:hypothetical protein